MDHERRSAISAHKYVPLLISGTSTTSYGPTETSAQRWVMSLLGVERSLHCSAPNPRSWPRAAIYAAA